MGRDVRRALGMLLLCACTKSAPVVAVGPLGLGIPPGFVESSALEKKVANSPRGDRLSRVWRDESSKLVLSLAVSKLPHQPEWSQYPARETLNEIVNQAIEAGERAGLTTVHGARHEEGQVLRYDLDSKLTQAGKTIFTFSRAGMWLDADGTLVNANAVCTSDEAHVARCPELLSTLVLEAPPGARPLDGGS